MCYVFSIRILSSDSPVKYIYIVVLGGSGGIGRAVARSLALEGASVVVLDQKEERAQEVVATLSSEFGANHVAVRADVSSKDDVILALQKVRESCSAVPSIVVNNAGITRDALLLKATEEQFDEVIKVNLKVSSESIIALQNKLI